MAGISTPMFVLETPTWEWEPFTTCCLKRASEWDTPILNFPFFLSNSVACMQKRGHLTLRSEYLDQLT